MNAIRFCSRRQQANSGVGGVGARHSAFRPTGAGRSSVAHQGVLERATALRHRLAFYGGEK